VSCAAIDIGDFGSAAACTRGTPGRNVVTGIPPIVVRLLLDLQNPETFGKVRLRPAPPSEGQPIMQLTLAVSLATAWTDPPRRATLTSSVH